MDGYYESTSGLRQVKGWMASSPTSSPSAHAHPDPQSQSQPFGGDPDTADGSSCQRVETAQKKAWDAAARHAPSLSVGPMLKWIRRKKENH